ncbi:TrkH family potassium uptake protein [Glycomyces sp. TRM65418]|uniref:TrkH family potassium uptake protein n=1 Tax=Glycomyces sp. TRM65418 TaxID=2867006 RepID=UPI001CE5A60F|nr:potassium transporter TrkG [Glycomyces sp. TRM65418]MCC3763831.1 TrkH family potassium uptake protein [Glycomyces sp. TRM65418]QZD53537.1 TrkH family potassium uptake protein [Glycomyces sp. TRM65418]
MHRYSEWFTRHPVRLVPFGFGAAIALCTFLLMLPVAQAGPGGTEFVDALYTATSAITVTGLITLDTPVHWSLFGEAVILVGMQIGGLGIMASAAFLGLVVSKKLGLRSRLIAQAEVNRNVMVGDLKEVIRRTVIVMLSVETVAAVILSLRFHHAYGFSGGSATWQGVFHSVSAFNSGGFSLFSNSMMDFAHDPWIIGTIIASSVIGGLGMPVLFEIARRNWGHRKWTLHTKMTLTGTTVLFVGGFFVFLGFEWSNPATLGPMGWDEKLLPALFQSVMPRSTGFNSIEVGDMETHSLLSAIVLMFIGGGSASTAGGIKVTTFFVLLWVIWSEVRGEPDVSAFRTRLSSAVIRQALSVALVYVAFIAAGVLLMQMFEPHMDLAHLMFEATSAGATVGQSAGITGDLSDPSKWVSIVLMFGGRMGPVLLATSLAIRSRHRLYRYPEGRPLVG